MTVPARVPSPLDLRERHGVETPEHVAVHLELAGAGSRTAAVLVDFVVLTLPLIVAAIVLANASVEPSSAASGWAEALGIILVFGWVAGYFTLFEALNGGRTPGKLLLGLRVVMDTGRPVTVAAAVTRNVVRLVDCVALLGVPALLAVFLTRANQRPGDLAAGTIVVRNRPTERLLQALPPVEEPDLVETGPPDLSEDEFRLLDRFLARMNDLDPAVQLRLAADLARRFEAKVPRRTTDTQAYLVQLFAEEQRRRRSRFATRARGDAAGRTTVTAERFIARKRDAWEAFHAVATRIEKTGVAALPAGEIPAFAARYREITADLARARTYGVDPRVVEYLERLVGAGHNALYGARRARAAPLWHYVARDFPAAVVQSRAYVLVAALLLVVSAAAGYAVVRQRPDLTDQLVPDVLVSRAQQAAENEARGVGYAQSPDAELPVISAGVTTNNIRVALLEVAGGITAGVLTALSILFNGFFALGVGYGVFANYHAAGYLTTFIVGHGVLELTALCIAGAAGFRIAHAIIAPGDRPRRDALAIEGAIAARLVGAVVCLLAMAGTIEGLLSASDAPAALKYGVSAASVVLLVAYMESGRRQVRQSA